MKFLSNLKKSLMLLVATAFCATTFAINPPDEGMWLPMFIKNYNYAQMQKLGLRLTAEQLYDINNSSLKDAIVQLGDGFCTGEMVSRDGLMFTNHHCGYSSVVELSSVEHDYLENGFFAMSREEELPANFHVNFLERMEDVTSIVLAEVKEDATESAREKVIEAAIKKLQKENSNDGRYKVVVKPFYEGNEYYMFIYTTYEDVRLVCAPPSAIGKFGGDTDNWMWPRHTGDFTVFRIYTAPDGSPAKYAKENVPFHPKHFLPISIKGYQPGDYTMIWGYPGSTQRFMTSYEVQNAINVNDPAIYEPLDIILPVINDHMNADAAVRLQYADDYAGLANYWKNQHGEVTSLQNLRVVEKKQQQERELTEWINASSERQKKYGNCLNEIKKAVEGINGDAYKAMTNANLCLSSSATLLTGWRTRNALSLKKGEKGFTPEKIETLMKTYEKNLGNKDKATEIDIIMATLKTWERLPVDKRPDIDGFLAKNFKGSKENFKNALANSIFISKENFEKFVKKPNNKVLEKDPVYQYLQSLLSMIMVNQHVYSDAEKVDLPRRTYLAALKEMNANTPMYPDANSTMRTTYGTVCDYYPADGVHYNYFTTTKGILEKEIPGDPEFDVPAKLKDLILNKDFGQYADKDGTLHVCFLSNNDITGGNSGSPIMNGNGELIGLAFDGNWEALSSDIVFNTELQRCINVDSRYVLFIIDKFGGQGYLLNEMDIRK
ncbi:MAG: S46 family peptidase [Bacteroidales bacterium]|nr:S46 family peptidase [Bacteroidales bacterium]